MVNVLDTGPFAWNRAIRCGSKYGERSNVALGQARGAAGGAGGSSATGAAGSTSTGGAGSGATGGAGDSGERAPAAAATAAAAAAAAGSDAAGSTVTYSGWGVSSETFERSSENGAGVSGFASSSACGSPSPSPSRASRRQRGPSRWMTISSSLSQASPALGGRSFGSFFRSHSSHSPSCGSIDGSIVDGAGIGLADVTHEHRHRRLRVAERHLAEHHLVGHDPERVEVGPRPHLLRHRLLGRHVGGRADRGPGRGQELRGVPGLVERAADPEVGDLHPALAGDHHVLRLHVAMDDPAARCVLEARRASPSSTPPICASVRWPTSGRSDPRSMYSIEMYGVPSCSK